MGGATGRSGLGWPSAGKVGGGRARGGGQAGVLKDCYLPPRIWTLCAVGDIIIINADDSTCMRKIYLVGNKTVRLAELDK